MKPKPSFCGPEHASAFEEATVADAYQYRPPYPSATFDILGRLAVDHPRHVLDAGCGTGAIARGLVDRVHWVDAVDIAHSMIHHGQQLPRGDHLNLQWIVGPIEDVVLAPPYDLITAGDSLHWMDWCRAMSRFAEILTPNGYLAILGVEQLPLPWEEELWSIRRRYSTITDFKYYDLVAGLEERDLFQQVGKRRTEPESFRQTLNEYIQSFHGRAAFSRQRMSPQDVAAFDAEVRAIVRPHMSTHVEMQLVSTVVWGKPLPDEEHRLLP